MAWGCASRNVTMNRHMTIPEVRYMVSTRVRQVVAGVERMPCTAEVCRTHGLQKQRKYANAKWQSKN
jgi:hypothetical protein